MHSLSVKRRGRISLVGMTAFLVWFCNHSNAATLTFSAEIENPLTAFDQVVMISDAAEVSVDGDVTTWVFPVHGASTTTAAGVFDASEASLIGARFEVSHGGSDLSFFLTFPIEGILLSGGLAGEFSVLINRGMPREQAFTSPAATDAGVPLVLAPDVDLFTFGAAGPGFFSGVRVDADSIVVPEPSVGLLLVASLGLIARRSRG